MIINCPVNFYLERNTSLLKCSDMLKTNSAKMISCKTFTSVFLILLFALSLTLYEALEKSHTDKNKIHLVQTPLTDQLPCYSYIRTDVVKIYCPSACGKLSYSINCFYIWIRQNQTYGKNCEIIITFRRIHRFAKFSTSTFS